MNADDFIPLLARKLGSSEAVDGPRSCHWDAVTRVMTCAFRGVEGRPARDVQLTLPEEAVSLFAGGNMDKDVRDVWGEGVETVEGAARFATIYLAELVHTSRDNPVRLELTSSGIIRQD